MLCFVTVISYVFSLYYIYQTNQLLYNIHHFAIYITKSMSQEVQWQLFFQYYYNVGEGGSSLSHHIIVTWPLFSCLKATPAHHKLDALPQLSQIASSSLMATKCLQTSLTLKQVSFKHLSPTSPMKWRPEQVRNNSSCSSSALTCSIAISD